MKSNALYSIVTVLSLALSFSFSLCQTSVRLAVRCKCVNRQWKGSHQAWVVFL